MAKCPECGNPRGHNAYCSRAPGGGTGGGRPQHPPDPKKQNPARRPDDGRKRKP